MTVILEDYTIVGTGDIEIRRPVHLVVSAREAQRRVNSWFCLDVGNLLIGGEPTLVVGEVIRWQVPVLLSAPHTGPVGVVGTVEVDATSGAINKDPANLERIHCAARRLRETLPSFQVKEVPPQYLAPHRQPTHAPGRPSGNPADLIHHPRGEVE